VVVMTVAIGHPSTVVAMAVVRVVGRGRIVEVEEGGCSGDVVKGVVERVEETHNTITRGGVVLLNAAALEGATVLDYTELATSPPLYLKLPTIPQPQRVVGHITATADMSTHAQNVVLRLGHGQVDLPWISAVLREICVVYNTTRVNTSSKRNIMGMRTHELHSEIVVFVTCNPQVAPRWYGSSVVAGPETGPFYYHG
jgi:hypothetical protein